MTIYYARPDGGHFHSSKRCPLLDGGDFERLGYVEISAGEKKSRKLRECSCVDNLENFIKNVKLTRGVRKHE